MVAGEREDAEVRKFRQGTTTTSLQGLVEKGCFVKKR